jgi:hypothetical protein
LAFDSKLVSPKLSLLRRSGSGRGSSKNGSLKTEYLARLRVATAMSRRSSSGGGQLGKLHCAVRF